MKQLLSLFMILWIYQPDSACQPADIMVKNIYCHEILDGKETGNKYVCVQKTYDNNNRLVLERFYDDKVREQVGYRWYFYNSQGKIKSVENFNMNQLPERLIQVLYGESGDTMKIIEYAGGKEAINKTSEKYFYYSSSGQLKQTRTVTSSNNPIETVKYSYKSGLKSPVKASISNKSAVPFKEKATFVYVDSTGLPISAVRQMNDLQNKNRYKITVSYNRKGKPIEELYVSDNRPFKKKIYKYAAEIELENCREEDGMGKLTALYTVETYFHKANIDRKSYFE